MQIYLNGRIVDHAQATVSVDDRGFLFADGVYEVVRLYGGRPFQLEPHMRRMRMGLRALRIDPAPLDALEPELPALVEANDVRGDGTIYVQVTRGAAPRRHAFPAAGTAPTVYAFAKPFAGHPDHYFSDGVAAVSVPDTRWARCDIKSIALLPNVLANQTAHENDAFEALFVKDGVLIEGSHSNLFGVVDGTLVTYPSCNYILTGITRNVVLDIARELDIPACEGPITADRFDAIEELFLSGTTTEVMPVTRLDGRPVNGGEVGPITRRLQEGFRQRVESL